MSGFSSSSALDFADDFSFASLSSTASAAVIDSGKTEIIGSPSTGLMGTTEVARVLQDRLDLFPVAKTRDLASHLLRVCATHHFDPAFILSMIDVESSFRVKARSPVGAVGLMQLMPATAAVVAKKFNLRYTGARSLEDPYTNLSLGVTYLSYLREKFQANSPYYHVAAYNVGPARMRELMKQVNFRPEQTWVYYRKIKGGMTSFRHYETRAQVRMSRLAKRLAKKNAHSAGRIIAGSSMDRQMEKAIASDHLSIHQSHPVEVPGGNGV